MRTVRARHKHALTQYRITQADYDGMLADQKYVCAICRQPESALMRGATRRLSVDHCHDTGRVRGLLCMHCNHAIGKLKDSPALLRRAADYLEAKPA